MKRKFSVDPDAIGDDIKMQDFRLMDGRTLRVACWIAADGVSLRQAAKNFTRAMYQKAWELGREKPDETEVKA